MRAAPDSSYTAAGSFYTAGRGRASRRDACFTLAGRSQQVVYGTGSVLGTLFYAPVKASFCILGAISSGFAYPIAGARTAGNIASTTCAGPWTITPGALKGEEPVKFVGDRSQSRRLPHEVGSPAGRRLKMRAP